MIERDQTPLGLSVASGISDRLRERCFTRVQAHDFHLTEELLIAQRRLFAEWDDLKPDDYLRDNANFRVRRFGFLFFDPRSDELLAMPPAPYYQGTEINDYAGGIKRDFAPLSEATLGNAYLRELILLMFRQLPIEPERLTYPWKVDVHQVRITASSDERGEPTPEGPHHDGEEFGAIQVVQRRNVTGGVSTVYSNAQEPIATYTLREPMDSLLWWDPHVMHGVSPIRPADPDQWSIRDTLLIGYDPQPDLERPDLEGPGRDAPD